MCPCQKGQKTPVLLCVCGLWLLPYQILVNISYFVWGLKKSVNEICVGPIMKWDNWEKGVAQIIKT